MIDIGTGGLAAPAGQLPGPESSSFADPVAAARSFFLPQGWPHTVTPDYLRYQLFTFPSHVTGWISHCE